VNGVTFTDRICVEDDHRLAFRGPPSKVAVFVFIAGAVAAAAAAPVATSGAGAEDVEVVESAEDVEVATGDAAGGAVWLDEPVYVTCFL